MGNPARSQHPLDLKRFITDVPDFPKPGILFRDITPLLRDHLEEAIEHIGALFTSEEWTKTDYVAGIESRGFILASALALRHKKGFVPIRKAGKLPGKTARMKYGLEYGEAEVEMHFGRGSLIIIDDVLATGGTLAASAELARTTGHDVIGLGVLIDLAFLNDFAWAGMHARAVLSYE